MTSLVLIKHSMPDVKADIPSKQWTLSDEGRERSVKLAGYLKQYKARCIYTSLEPKAIQTGEVVSNQLNLPHKTVRDVHENDRTHMKYLPRNEYETIFKEYFANPSKRIVGNETAEDAAKRFDKAVKKVMKEDKERDIILITHGTVMSLFVNEDNDVDVFNLWNSLQLPSIIELSMPDFQIRKIVEEI
ncbi:MAG TPA: histidine phosphatase family protein [Bacillales bacterium]|nr:histidine phosphatase family protein [Bacillales bacterium]HEU5140792.1 histidine phosphatase family protein [Bacillales bacterium]